MTELTVLSWSRSPRATRVADGWPRRAWTHADLDRMVETGLLAPDERVELIAGEIVPSSPKGIRHEVVRRVLGRWINRHLTTDNEVLAEPGWRPEPDSYLEPDLLVVPASVAGVEFTGDRVLLVVEIADTSLAYDTGLKRDRYAVLGVREYWVVDAWQLTTRVFREPTPTGYEQSSEHPAGEQLTPHLAPEIAVRLGDLDIGG